MWISLSSDQLTSPGTSQSYVGNDGSESESCLIFHLHLLWCRRIGKVQCLKEFALPLSLYTPKSLLNVYQQSLTAVSGWTYCGACWGSWLRLTHWAQHSNSRTTDAAPWRCTYFSRRRVPIPLASNMGPSSAVFFTHQSIWSPRMSFIFVVFLPLPRFLLPVSCGYTMKVKMLMSKIGKKEWTPHYFTIPTYLM